MQNAHATGRTIRGHQRAFFRQAPVDSEYSSISIPSGHIYSNITDMARWMGIHLGLIDVPENFARVVQRSQQDFHTSSNPFAEFDYYHVAGGWLVWSDSGNIEHNGTTTGYFAVARISNAYDTAVVILGNLGVFGLTVTGLADVTLDAVIHGVFDRVGVDFYVILDIVLTAAIIWGIFSLYKLVRLLIKTVSRIRGSETIKYNGIKAKWLFDLVFAVAVLLAVYVILPNIFGLPTTLLIIIMPINFLIAIIFAWIDLAHSLFGLWTKAFLEPQAG